MRPLGRRFGPVGGCDHERDAMSRDVPRPIKPARAGLDVVVRVPGSKSVTNRALLLAALAGGVSTLDGALVADDTAAFVSGLRGLGFEVDEDRSVAGDPAGRIPVREASVWCADAGTAARFLLAACAAGNGRYTVDASAQMRRRPMGLLLEALRAQGAAFEPADADSLPVTVLAGGLAGGVIALPGDVSSQFVSALLMVAPLARVPLTIDVSGLVSRPYVDMTLAMMAQFGVDAEREGYASFRLRPATYQAREYTVEPDASTASYFFAAAAVAPGRVTVPGLRRRGGLQGDVRFLDVLEAMGCRVTEDDVGLTVEGPACAGPPAAPAPLAGLTVDMTDISDTFMTLAAIAPFASSPVTMTGIANVRLKESDRIAAMEEGLRRVGVRTESGPDHVRVYPGHPRAAALDPHGDHRIAMSFSVLGLRTPGVVIDDPACVRKTCPPFFELWKQVEAEA
jgi:3-phosphoshikimate 1-carboxyvinyltransferase